MIKTVTIDEAQSQLEELLRFAEKGNEVIITQNEKPLARLVPMLSTANSRIDGLSGGKMSTSNDFDDRLPDEFWSSS